MPAATAFTRLIEFLVGISVGIFTGIIITMVGTGLWVTENRGVRFWTLFIRALKLEKKESTDLIKALARPHGAKQLMAVFRAMALVDKHVDERELEMMRLFAHRWRVDLPHLEVGEHEGGGDLLQLRRAVQDYLASTPPPEQAQELLDVLRLFVQADEKVTREEEMVLEEFAGMIGAYSGADGGGGMHEVVIVPQDRAQTEAVQDLLPGIEPKVIRGGRVYSVGRFFSARYADTVSQKYIDLGLFTATVEA